MGSLIDELKRRNILKVVTAYAVAGFIILQLCDIMFPALGIADEVIGYVVIGLVIGLPIVVGFAWMFEMTPDGIRRTHEVSHEDSISHFTGQRINYVIIALLSVALAFFAWEYFNDPDPIEMADTTNQAIPTTVAPTAPTDTRPSVAVLPFVNMSSDQENEHFSDGLTEEMLNLLAQSPELKVAGRTSSFFYKGKNQNLRDIGIALNVAHLLEGSVRKSGNKVRITAQLINAEDGFHLWSETFDREIHDIFAVQDEIAGKVANAMRVTLLTDGVTVADRTTSNPEAHDYYLRAKSELYIRTIDSIRRAISLYEQSIALDPEYGPPLIEYATALIILYNNHNVGTYEEVLGKAWEALEKARNLGYTDSDYYAALGLYYDKTIAIEPENLRLSFEAFEKAIELNENNVSAYMWYAGIIDQDHDNPNRFERAIELNEKALQLDPLNRVASGNQVGMLTNLGRTDEAEAYLRRMLRLDSEYETYQIGLAQLLFSKFELEAAAIQLMDVPRTNRNHPFLLYNLFAIFGMEEAMFNNIDTIPIDNPNYEWIELFETAHDATPAELRSEAEVALLQPDPDAFSLFLVTPLIENGDFALAKQLVENSRPNLLQTMTTMELNSGMVPAYLMILKHEGDPGVRSHAERMLQLTDRQPYIGPAGRGIAQSIYFLLLDDRESAIRDIEAAYKAGWLGYFQADIEETPYLMDIADDPRIIAVKEGTSATLNKQRDAVFTVLKNAGYSI